MSTLPLSLRQDDSLDELLVRAGQGDEESFVRLHALARPWIVDCARRLLRDPDIAEDVAQEVLAWLWRHAAAFDSDRGSARSWISTITRRRAIDAVRSEEAWRRRQTVVALGSDVDGTEEHARTADLVCVVRATMTRLTALQHEAILLAFAPDAAGYQGVAERLGVNVCTLKSRVHSGIVGLRRHLVTHDVA